MPSGVGAGGVPMTCPIPEEGCCDGGGSKVVAWTSRRELSIERQQEKNSDMMTWISEALGKQQWGWHEEGTE